MSASVKVNDPATAATPLRILGRNNSFNVRKVL
jgi:hypothetical protein